MDNRKYGSLSSSVDSQKLATTVQGVILGASSLIIFLGAYFGHTILPDQIESFATNIGVTISAATAVISTLAVVFGVLRKIVVSFAQRD